jgi:hypothetical protein
MAAVLKQYRRIFRGKFAGSEALYYKCCVVKNSAMLFKKQNGRKSFCIVFL